MNAPVILPPVAVPPPSQFTSKVDKSDRRRLQDKILKNGYSVLRPFVLTALWLLTSLLCSSAIYAQTFVVPPPGLVSWWPGDGNANDIVDANHGTLQNGATFATGLVGQAFSLDGVNDFVSVPNSPSLNLLDWTLNAWIKTTNAGTSFRRIYSHQVGRRAGQAGTAFRLMQLENNQLTACFQSSDGVLDTPNDGTSAAAGCIAVPGQFLNDDQFHFVAVTREAGVAVKFYIDGVLVKTVALTNTAAVIIPADVFIGSAGPAFSNVQSFNGLIDEVGIFNRALSAAEIQALFDAACAGKCRDSDSDGVPDEDDLCPGTTAGDPVDANGCADAQVDGDGDSVCDPGAASGGPSACTGSDNCLDDANPGQEDFDGDGAGDACDAIVNVDGAIDVLTLTVEALDLKKGLENALITKLENALASFEAGNTGAAVNKLGAFINQVNAKRGKDISDAEADALIGFAQAIIDAINGGTADKRGDGADEAEVAAEVPETYVLEGNYPNPFNPQTTIPFSVSEASVVKLVVYDVLGREVRVLVNGVREAGTHEVVFDASTLPSGTYLYRLTAGAFTETKVMTLLK